MFKFHRTVKNVLVAELRDEILRGTFRPGQRLRLNELAERFGVSTMPIREALRDLEAEGIVTSIPHRGAFVTRLSAAEMEDIYDIRIALEVMATRLAVPRIGDETVARLETRLTQMDEHTDTTATFIQLNHQFHMTLYVASNRTHLCELIRTLRYRTHHYMHAFKLRQGDMNQIQDEHRAIVAACAAGDVEQATTLVHDHIDKVGRAIVEYMRQQEEREG